MWGSSGMVMARHPLAATRRTSSASASGSQTGWDGQRDEAARVRSRPLVDVPVVVGLGHHQCQILVRLRWKKPALKPAKDGKHIDARIPLRFMSRTRSWMS